MFTSGITTCRCTPDKSFSNDPTATIDNTTKLKNSNKKNCHFVRFIIRGGCCIPVKLVLASQNFT